jgi:hypothetical protein
MVQRSHTAQRNNKNSADAPKKSFSRGVVQVRHDRHTPLPCDFRMAPFAPSSLLHQHLADKPVKISFIFS